MSACGHNDDTLKSESNLQDDASESRSAARGGVIGFVGAATSSGLGFVLTMLMTRLLGERGAGAVMQAMAIFSIAISLAKLGMDSVAIWIVPRMMDTDPAGLRRVIRLVFLITAIAGAVGGCAVVGWSRFYRAESTLSVAVFVVGLAVPIGALQVVSLSIIRGLGDLRAYVAIGNILLPTLRPIILIAVTAVGGTAVGVTVGWVAPLPLALIAAGAVAVVMVRRVSATGPDPNFKPALNWKPHLSATASGGPTIRQLLKFAIPRTISAGLEQSIQWLDLLLVGAIIGSASAGIYGGASRFIAAGLIIDTALRVVVSPRFSALLHSRKVAALQALYRDSAIWLVLFSSPIFAVLAINAQTVLRWLGPGFTDGTPTLVTLCIGVTVTLMAGNIHSVLLMSGRSGWAALNKVVALSVNVVGNFLMIPAIGIEGAALAWVASMLIDALLASIEVKKFVGIRLQPWRIAYATLPAVISFLAPGVALLLTLGHGIPMLSANVVIGTATFLLWCWVDKDRLQLANIAAAIRRK